MSFKIPQDQHSFRIIILCSILYLLYICIFREISVWKLFYYYRQLLFQVTHIQPLFFTNVFIMVQLNTLNLITFSLPIFNFNIFSLNVPFLSDKAESYLNHLLFLSFKILLYNNFIYIYIMLERICNVILYI